MISFREVGVDDAKLILDWRVSNRVTQFMRTDIDYDVEAQRRWISMSYGKAQYYHWLIYADEQPIGLIYLSEYDQQGGCTSWGFYIGELGCSGYGAFIPPYFYNFVFETLRVETVRAEVFFNNQAVIGLHLLHGYRFNLQGSEVFRKKGKEVLLIGMTLTRSDWKSQQRFARCTSDFPMLRWEARPHFVMG